MRDRLRAAAWPVLLGAVLACAPGDDTPRRALESEVAHRLVGAWDVAFDVDSLTSASRLGSGRHTSRGSLTLTMATHGPASTDRLRGITHVGVYDVDFAPLGFRPEGPGSVTTVVARVAPAVPAVPAVPQAATEVRRDSVYVVLSPDAERFAVRLAGIVIGDSVAGTWSASAFSAGGVAGHFVMRRHAGQP